MPPTSNRRRPRRGLATQQTRRRVPSKLVPNATLCKRYFNEYDTFEDKVEELFKRNKIDITSTTYNLQKEILKDFKHAIKSNKHRPQDDFYSYINQRWLSEYDLASNQKYIVQVDEFRLVQDQVYHELIDIVKETVRGDNGHTERFRTCLSNAYRSFQKYNTQSQTQRVCRDMAAEVDRLREDPSNLWQLLGYLNQNEMISWGAPFVWSLNPDDRNPTRYQCYVEPPQVTLIMMDLYFDDYEDAKFKKKYLEVYFRYLADIFENAFGKDHGYDIYKIYQCEQKIVMAMGCNGSVEEDDLERYNVVTQEEAMRHFGFDWHAFAHALGFERSPSHFVTSSINYLQCCTKLLLDEWDSEDWRAYWVYILIRQPQKWNEFGHETYYKFHGEFVRGQESDVDESIVPIFGLGFCFNTFLTNEYIARYQNEQSVQYVKTMAEDLKTVFQRILKRNTWLQPSTKRKAIEKLKAFKLTVGSPELLRQDPLLDYDPNDSWGNFAKMAAWRHQQAISLYGQPVIDIPVMDWSVCPPKFIGTQAYVVNASYTPTENGIYIPLGYIQKPFVDLEERGIEYNLSRIGFTLAHEMSHALDDWGSQYDAQGRLHNWWTDKDRATFKRIQTEVVEQYEAFAKLDGITFDAWPSIGEDIADISGFFICQEYLRDFQFKNQDFLKIQSLSFETFYTYFAIQNRQKLSKKALLAQLHTNPHPLDKFRCNVPLSRSKIFRDLFSVTERDKMWWKSTNNIWGS